MTFITDRTESDALLGNAKGTYNYFDLNRVESAVEAISAKMGLGLTTKTDWAAPGTFSVYSWPVQSQMERYLGNVRTIRDAFSLSIPLPSSMNRLTWQSANNIERVLEEALKQIEKGV